ncbi:hypothetical protein NLJ89_g9978 [Agrocybe chaxingu]|uniref:F-box domain-containing protein n=1 Tax=Agrocybe chaxingu TaxID=84603 RepID=A0A9W8JUZ1_9AGAR|nr:hypothetical protein NLJ89_g9978 [Agrocybe chaxingu]
MSRRKLRRRGVQIPVQEQLRLLDEEQAEANRVFEERRALLLRQQANFLPTPTDIRAVPPEILAETFSHLVNGDSRNLIFPSHVCRLWRDVILRDAALWTCIHLGDHDKPAAVALRFLKTCIQRAHERPFSLFINDCKKIMSMSGFMNSLVVLAHASRWESLALTAEQIEDCIVLIDGLPPSSIQTIKELSFLRLDGRTHSPLGEALPQKNLNLQRFAALKALTINFPNRLSNTKETCSWNQLTDLKLSSGMRSIRFLAILRHCASLNTCSISLNSNFDKCDLEKSGRLAAKTCLPNLKKLELVAEAAPSLLPTRLICPALQEATFFYNFNSYYVASINDDLDDLDDDPGIKAKLEKFVQNCGKTLRKLQVPGAFYDGLGSCASKLENLEELVVVGEFNNMEDDCTDQVVIRSQVRDFFRPLIVTDKKAYLPRLRTLRLLEQEPRAKEYIEDNLFQVVKSRMSETAGVVRLGRVVLKMDESSQRWQKLEAHRRGYREWENQGLRVELDG